MPRADLRSDNKESRKEIAARLHRLLAHGTLVVDANIAGLKEGMLASNWDDPEPTADDGNDWLPPLEGGAPVIKFRVLSTPKNEPEWRVATRFAIDASEDGDGEREWLIVEKWWDADAAENARSISRHQQSLSDHQSWAEAEALALAKRLDLPAPYRDALASAARLHDEGKRHPLWQRAFNAPRDQILAKTRGPLNAALLGGYRHEFGSLPYAEKDERLNAMPPPLKDLALHLIAAHHGFARPVIDTAGCEDAPPSLLRERAAEVALRFARLQKQWGHWGLAWWEALLRAADQQASRRLEEGEGP
jgi:CRISPR-associated endonuclease/helicase Cas3